MRRWASFFLFAAMIQLCCLSAAANWTKQNSGTLAWLQSIYFVDQNRGWIVGSQGTFLTTTDGGATWHQEKKFTADKIRDVYFLNSQDGWLLCEQDVYSAPSGGKGSSPSYILKTADGGASWQRINLTEFRERIARIFFAPSGKAFATGENGAFWAMNEDSKLWKRIALPIRYLILGGKFLDESRALLIGGGGTVLLSEDNGSNWNQIELPDRSKTKLNALFFINQKTGWIAGDQGKIYLTNNGGKIWQAQKTAVAENISDIFFTDQSEGFAVGNNGTILHTTNAGDVWTTEPIDFKSKLEKVFFIGDKGFAVGFGGAILTYNPPQKSDKVN